MLFLDVACDLSYRVKILGKVTVLMLNNKSHLFLGDYGLVYLFCRTRGNKILNFEVGSIFSLFLNY